MPADSSDLPSRWISEVRAWTVLIRYRVRSRTSLSSAGGIYEPRSSPHSNSSASRAQSFASVLCPFSALACAGLITATSVEVLLTQRVIHRIGVDPAGLHHHVGHAPAAQLAGHRLQHPVKRPELQDLGLAGPRLIPRGPDRDLDHVLVHVDSRDALVQHLHLRGHLLQRHPPTDGNKRAAGQGPGSVQETDTRARSGNGGYPTKGAPAPI